LTPSAVYGTAANNPAHGLDRATVARSLSASGRRHTDDTFRRDPNEPAVASAGRRPEARGASCAQPILHGRHFDGDPIEQISRSSSATSTP